MLHKRDFPVQTNAPRPRPSLCNWVLTRWRPTTMHGHKLRSFLTFFFFLVLCFTFCSLFQHGCWCTQAIMCAQIVSAVRCWCGRPSRRNSFVELERSSRAIVTEQRTIGERKPLLFFSMAFLRGNMSGGLCVCVCVCLRHFRIPSINICPYSIYQCVSHCIR